jgi:hypothetical protein
MILGVVSDTHNRVDHINKIVSIFNSNGVDYVIHTGDITQAKSLEQFSLLKAKLLGVFGNNDLEEEGLEAVCIKHGFEFQLPPLVINLDKKKIAIFHEPEGIEDFMHKEDNLDLILHGHTHRYRLEEINEVKIFNPGECAGSLKGKNAIGIVNLEDMEIKRIFF